MVDVSTFEDPIDVKLAMCRSTFEDPITVNFIIMLLYNCTRITPRVCTLVLFIIYGVPYIPKPLNIKPMR